MIFTANLCRRNKSTRLNAELTYLFLRRGTIRFYGNNELLQIVLNINFSPLFLCSPSPIPAPHYAVPPSRNSTAYLPTRPRRQCRRLHLHRRITPVTLPFRSSLSLSCSVFSPPKLTPSVGPSLLPRFLSSRQNATSCAACSRDHPKPERGEKYQKFIFSGFW